MVRPVWKGPIAFGLVHIPISLYPAIKRNDLSFHLLDSRDQNRIRYIRINEETGEEVPWDKVIKGYEFDKGNYVLLEDKDFQQATPENLQTIEIQNFIPAQQLDCLFFEKPYFVVPEKKAEKGYVLLHDVLLETKTIGIAKVVIHTREYLAALMPYEEGLLLNILRYAQEFRDFNQVLQPNVKKIKSSKTELNIAKQLVNSMTAKWEPKKYHDEYREILMHWIEQKIKRKGKTPIKTKKAPKEKQGDFMHLLKASLKAQEHSRARKTLH